MTVTMQMEGKQRVVDILIALGEGVVKAAEDGLVDVQETILETSFPDVPRDTGDLEGSAFGNDPELASDSLSIEGGYNIVYAHAHEVGEEFVHPKKGKAHYLGDAVNRTAQKIPGIMEKHIEPAIKQAAREG